MRFLKKSTILNPAKWGLTHRPEVVTPATVIWIYENLLGRKPENESVVEYWVSGTLSLTELLKGIFASPEYQNIHKLYNASTGSSDNTTAALRQQAIHIIRKLQPMRVESHQKIRAGNKNDGGYVMVDDFEDILAAYSLGICDDVSWDLEVANRDIEVFLYDHTIATLPESHVKFHWRRQGIASKEHAQFTTLTGAVASNGHLSSPNLLLKCDIEGSEWEVLAGIESSLLSNFRQIIIELHNLDRLGDATFLMQFTSAITKLTDNHTVVHVHGNNNAGLVLMSGLPPLPECLELTLVRTSNYSLVPSTEVYPTNLDAPCHPDKPDLMLGAFRY